MKPPYWWGRNRSNLSSPPASYQRTFDGRVLAELTLDRVAEALDPRLVRERLKRQRQTGTTVPPASPPDPGEGENGGSGSPPGGSSDSNILNRKQFDRRFAEAILNGEDDAAEAMTRALVGKIGTRSPQDDKGTVRFALDEQDVVLPIDEKLIEFVHQFCTEEHFGGKFRSKEGALRAAIDRLEVAEDIVYYNPSQPLSGEAQTSISDILSLFDAKFPGLGLNGALSEFIERRRALLPFVDVLIADPFVAVPPTQLDLFEDYLAAANRLMDIIRSKCDEMREASDVFLQICLAQLLALDTRHYRKVIGLNGS